jgi:hypothetical protein
MELNNKVKELEDELKVLKAEIRNVLLDIREVILDKSNPLAEEHESAFLRMDLNTTSRAMAAEAAAHQASLAMEEAAKHDNAAADDATQTDEEAKAEETEEEKKGEEKPEDQDTSANSRKGKGSRKGKEPKADEPLDPAEIPAMFRAPAVPPAGALVLATWVVDAMKALGPHQLDRVIAIHRLCGNLPPNISEALTHLQELIRTSEGEEPPWLDALQGLDKLVSS